MSSLGTTAIFLFWKRDYSKKVFRALCVSESLPSPCFGARLALDFVLSFVFMRSFSFSSFLGGILLFGGFLLLAGCGEIELPEEGTSEETIIIGEEDDATLDEDDEMRSDEDEDNEEDTEDTDQDSGAEDDDLATCLEEKETLSEAVELNTEALRTCEQERKTALTQMEAAGSGETVQQYQKFLDFYLENAALAEFPFPTCGNMSTLSGQGWFSGFSTALAAKQLPFGRRTVTTEDLTGGCVSPEGNMAFLLGAESGELFECYLLKYDLSAQTVEEAFFATSSTACPTVLGKRQGPYLTLLSDNNGTQEFRYYYASNILK